jgi:RimJ/RimL family protein N-acetyltransferase
VSRDHIEGHGTVSIRAVGPDDPRPRSTSQWDDWGDMAADAQDHDLRRWVVELTTPSGEVVPVGDMSAHAVWYGPTPGSRSLNIGISLLDDFRGHGIGSIAQRLLADALHDDGVVRVEAGTDVENIAEQRALTRAGFVHEGTLRLAQGRRDGLHDLQVWSHVRPPTG